MVIAVVGAVEPQNVIESVSQVLGDWINNNQTALPDVPEAPALQTTIRKSVRLPGKSQADIVMGFAAPNRQSADYFPLRIGNNIFGEFGMMGRLGQRVREEAGLAYYAYSSYSAGLGPGSIEMIAGVNPTNIEQTIQLISAEVTQFIAYPVTQEELSDSKSYFLGRMPLLLASNSGVAVALLNMERFNLGLDYFHQYPKNVENISAEQVLAAAQRAMDPDRIAIAIAGP